MSTVAMGLVAQHFPALPRPLPPAPCTVLLEHRDTEGLQQARDRFESLLSAALEARFITDAAVAERVAQAQALWQVRESVPLAQAAEGLNVKHDISAPVSAIADFVAATDAELQRCFPGGLICNFGHLGDGNLHYNVQAPAGADGQRFLDEHEHAVNTLVFDAVARFRGSFSAEHGIGALKREELALRKSPVALHQAGTRPAGHHEPRTRHLRASQAPVGARRSRRKILRYKVNGSAAMTEKAMVRARLRAWSGDRWRQW